VLSPRKILAIKIRALGDTVLMTAPLEELHQAYPAAEIHALVSTSAAPVLVGSSFVSKVWTFERQKDRASRARSLASLALKLRRQHFDTVVCFHASPSSATLAFATGARTRSIHFHGHRDKNRYSTVEVPGKGMLKPILERDMDAVRALGLHIPPGRLPEIRVLPVEQQSARKRLQDSGLPGPVLAIGLGASRPTKFWPADRYALLASRWCEETGGSAIAFMSPDEEPLGREFLRFAEEKVERSEVRRRITIESRLGLRDLFATIQQASVLVGNDSGPRHIAVAVGTPTVTVFGPEDPFEWHPYPVERHPFFYVAGLPCRRDALPGYPPWCGLDVCVEQQHRCMRGVGVDAVFEKVREVAKQ
jgi:ADP-heptose:LPS heptosyltransferase